MMLQRIMAFGRSSEVFAEKLLLASSSRASSWVLFYWTWSAWALNITIRYALSIFQDYSGLQEVEIIIGRFISKENISLIKQSTFRDAATCFPARWVVTTQIWVAASDWSFRERNLLQPIRSQLWAVTCLQYGISAVVAQKSFRGETSDGVTRCRLFFLAQARKTQTSNKNTRD